MPSIGSFGDSFLKGFFGADELKDYSHANRTFTPNGYQLSPRNKFLFHVFFNLNTAQIKGLQNTYSAGDQASIGLMVKTIDLPSFEISVDTMNQYNRKRLVQSKIDYQPVTINFHDDQSDLIRNLWYQYYSYYYKDPIQPYNNVSAQNGELGQLQTQPNGFGYNTRDIYNNSRPVSDWGFIGENYSDGTGGGTAGSSYTGKPAFFNDITIYGLSQKKFAAYTLINPVITSWKSDAYDYSQDDGTMAHQMTIKYETVKYYSGATGGTYPSNSVQGFAYPEHYDMLRSSLSRPGSTQTVFGQGGLLDALSGSVEDLQALASGQGGLAEVLGLVQKAGASYNTFKDKSIASIANYDARLAAQQVAQQALPGWMKQAMNGQGGQIFPTTLPNIYNIFK